jgi:hypothetical protein
MRGRAMARKEWYAVLRQRRANSDTRFAVPKLAAIPFRLYLDCFLTVAERSGNQISIQLMGKSAQN